MDRCVHCGAQLNHDKHRTNVMRAVAKLFMNNNRLTIKETVRLIEGKFITPKDVGRAITSLYHAGELTKIERATYERKI